MQGMVQKVDKASVNVGAQIERAAQPTQSVENAMARMKKFVFDAALKGILTNTDYTSSTEIRPPSVNLCFLQQRPKPSSLRKTYLS